MGYLTTHTSPSPIRGGFAPVFVNYKKGYTRLAATSDKVCQLLAHNRWFYPGTPASSTTKTARHDWYSWNIAESVAKHNKSNHTIPHVGITISLVSVFAEEGFLHVLICYRYLYTVLSTFTFIKFHMKFSQTPFSMKSIYCVSFASNWYLKCTIMHHCRIPILSIISCVSCLHSNKTNIEHRSLFSFITLLISNTWQNFTKFYFSSHSLNDVYLIFAYSLNYFSICPHNKKKSQFHMHILCSYCTLQLVVLHIFFHICMHLNWKKKPTKYKCTGFIFRST